MKSILLFNIEELSNVKAILEAELAVLNGINVVKYKDYADYKEVKTEEVFSKYLRKIVDSIFRVIKTFKRKYTCILGRKIFIKPEYFPQIEVRAPSLIIMNFY